jgi:putative membrane protein
MAPAPRRPRTADGPAISPPFGRFREEDRAYRTRPGAMLSAGSRMNDAPSITAVMSHFSFDVVWIAAILAALVSFIGAFLRASRLGPAKAHPRWKLACFGGGLFILAAAVLSPIEYYGNELLWVNFTGFLLLTMVAAPLILLGSPLTLAFRVCGRAGRTRLRRAYRSWPVVALTFPVVSWLTFAVTTYVWQFTDLTDLSAEHGAIRDLQQATLLLVALCFWMPALAADPMRWRMPHPLRALYVFVEMTHKGLFGGMFLSMSQPFHDGFATGLPAWANLAPIDDQRMGIMILWIGGNAIFIVAVAGIVLRWLQYERRNSHRTDWRLALVRERSRSRREALEQVFSRGP